MKHNTVVTVNLSVWVKGRFTVADVITDLSHGGLFTVKDFGRFGSYRAMSMTGEHRNLVEALKIHRNTCTVYVGD